MTDPVIIISQVHADDNMLLRDVERFLRGTGMPWTKFGRLTVNDPLFVKQLREGRTPRPRAETKVRNFMETYS